jgi:hypothetical protein
VPLEPDVPEAPLEPEVPEEPLPPADINVDILVPETYKSSVYTAFNGVVDEPRSIVVPVLTFSVSI